MMVIGMKTGMNMNEYGLILFKVVKLGMGMRGDVSWYM